MNTFEEQPYFPGNYTRSNDYIIKIASNLSYKIMAGEKAFQIWSVHDRSVFLLPVNYETPNQKSMRTLLSKVHPTMSIAAFLKF